jgi:tetratricopeptide (TPR) repeat protein
VFFCITANAQSIKKGLKYLNSEKFEKAEVEFNEVKEIDSLNPHLWFGYSLLFSNEKYVHYDLFLALEYVQKSNDLFNQLDIKKRKKIKKPFSIDTVIQQISIVDQKLFYFLKSKDNLVLYNKYLADFSNGIYANQIKKLRNTNEFNSAKTINTVDAYNNFINSYPDAIEVNEAKLKRNESAYRIAQEENSVDAYNVFINKYSDAVEVRQAVEKRNKIAFKITEEQNTIEAFNYFINTYPDAIEIKKALLKRNSLAFELAKKENSIDAYEDFLHKYPNAHEYCTVFHLRNEMLFIEEVKKQNKDSLSKLLIKLKEFENDTLRIENSIIERINKLQEMVYAKDFFIFYISNQNLFKINHADLKIEQITTEGNIVHFATNENNDIVFLVLKPDIAEFYKLESDNGRIKICDLKKLNIKDYFIFNSMYSGFYISNDLNQILLDFGDFEPEAGHTHRGLWDKVTNKWKICRVFEDGCDFNTDKIYFPQNDIIKVSYNSTDEYYVKKQVQTFDLYRRDKSKNEEINLSKINGIFQEVNSENYGSFFISKNKDKVFFNFIETCGDFCYGPFYIVNNDGTFLRQIIRTSSMGYNPYSWIEGSGDLIVQVEQQLILFSGKENIPRIIADSIIEFKKVHLPNCNYTYDIESFLKIYNEKMDYYFSIK